MPRTILFATDLSADNRAAFARALRLAYAQGVQLDVLHVLDPYLPRRVLLDVESAVVEDITSTLTDTRRLRPRGAENADPDRDRLASR